VGVATNGAASRLSVSAWEPTMHYHWHANGFGRRDHRCEGGGLCLEHGPPEHHNHHQHRLQVTGNISLNNNCGSISPLPTTRLRSRRWWLCPDCADRQRRKLHVHGHSRRDLHDHPSITGPNSLFYPATYSNVVLSASTVTGENFGVSLGYTVSAR